MGHILSTGIKSEMWKDAREVGMHDDGPMLDKYKLKSGKWVREVVQAVPWSSGPCIFLCLEDEDGKRLFEWTDGEIEKDC